MTTDRESGFRERKVQLPPLREPFGHDEVADWWDTIEGRLTPRRPSPATLRRPVLGLMTCGGLLVASGALAVGWPYIAPLARQVLALDPPAVTAVPYGSSLPSAARPLLAVAAPLVSSEIPSEVPSGASAAPVAPSASASPGLPAASSGAPAAPSAAPAVVAAPGASSGSAGASRGPEGPSSAWRELMRQGAFGDAYEALGAGGVSRASQQASVDDLFALADVARRSGHPREAVGPLSQIVQRGGGQAALAAFTLGRLHMDQLGEPAAAAQDFERAVGLGLGGSLREDALVRQVTALARSGQRDRAQEAARACVAQYPGARKRLEPWLPQPD